MNYLLSVSHFIAGISFLIGTVLFAFQLYFGNHFRIIDVGINFILIATIINAFLLIVLISNLTYRTIMKTLSSDEKLKALITMGLILLNIPVVILYLFVLIRFS